MSPGATNSSIYLAVKSFPDSPPGGYPVTVRAVNSSAPPGYENSKSAIYNIPRSTGGPGGTLINPFKAKSVGEFIETLISFIFWASLGIVPLMIIIAGFYFMTSGGDPEKVRTAKRIFVWTMIGFLIVLLARGLIAVIKKILGG